MLSTNGVIYMLMRSRGQAEIISIFACGRRDDDDDDDGVGNRERANDKRIGNLITIF